MSYTDNTYKTEEWDDTYAYYTIGQIGSVTEFIQDDIRWNNNNTTLWMIHNDGNSNLGGSFKNEYELSLTANTDKSTKATMEELLFIFGDATTENNGTYTLGADITIGEDKKGYFPISIENGKVFDGGNKTITYTGSSDWEGLFIPVSGTSGNPKEFTIQNIKFVLDGTNGANVADQHGCILAASHYSSTTTNYSFDYFSATINNCHTSATTFLDDGSGSGVKSAKIAGAHSGGICGKALGRENSTGTITNCINSIPISGENAGGICGSYFRGSVSDCNNSGKISSKQAGGICGQYAGKGQSLEIINCHNSGEISGNKAGGICGQYAGQGQSLEIINCSNSGNIDADYAGGICGSRAYSGTIQYCWNTGNIGNSSNTSGGSGGICGLRAADVTNSTLVISYCYNVGVITSKKFRWYMRYVCWE